MLLHGIPRAMLGAGSCDGVNGPKRRSSAEMLRRRVTPQEAAQPGAVRSKPSANARPWTRSPPRTSFRTTPCALRRWRRSSQSRARSTASRMYGRATSCHGGSPRSCRRRYAPSLSRRSGSAGRSGRRSIRLPRCRGCGAPQRYPSRAPPRPPRRRAHGHPLAPEVVGAAIRPDAVRGHASVEVIGVFMRGKGVLVVVHSDRQQALRVADASARARWASVFQA